MPCRLNGNCPQRIKLAHAIVDSPPCAERQIALLDDRRIGDDRHLAAGIRQNCRRLKSLVLQLVLRRVAKGRTDRHRKMLRTQFLCDQRAVRHMIEP